MTLPLERIGSMSGLMRTSLPDTVLKRVAMVVAGCGYLAVAVVSLVPGPFRPHVDGLSGREEHALAYLVLGVLTVIAARRTVNAYGLCLILAAYAGILELGQLFVAGRHAAVGDFMASTAGAIVGVTLTTLALKLRARKSAG